MGKHIMTVAVGVVIVGSLLTYLFFYQVRTNEVAVLLTFGAPAEKPVEPGWHLKWPWPIQDIHRYDNRLHVHNVRLEEMLTKEGNNIIMSVCTGWRIADVKRFDENFGRKLDTAIDDAWARLEYIVRNHTSGVMGNHVLNELVSTDKSQIAYDDIEAEISAGASEETLATYGVQIQLLKIARLELPQAVRERVYDRMREERNREAKKILDAGETEASNIRKEADTVADKILTWADKEAEGIRSKAERQRAKFAEELSKDPDLDIYLRGVRAFSEVAKKKTTFILDTNAPPWNIFNLPTHHTEEAPALAKEPSEK